MTNDDKILTLKRRYSEELTEENKLALIRAIRRTLPKGCPSCGWDFTKELRLQKKNRGYAFTSTILARHCGVCGTIFKRPDITYASKF